MKKFLRKQRNRYVFKLALFREKLEEYLSSSTGLERSVEHVRIPVA